MRPIVLMILAAFNCYGLMSCNSADHEKASGGSTQDSTLDKSWAKSFVDSVNSKFSEQIASGDSNALASHYWPDAELLLDNSEVVKGNDIVHAWGGAIGMGIKEMSFSTTDITGSPSFIIETGNYEMKDSAKTLLDTGKYVVVWEKRNGEWKLYRDIGCTSMPARK